MWYRLDMRQISKNKKKYNLKILIHLSYNFFSYLIFIEHLLYARLCEVPENKDDNVVSDQGSLQYSWQVKSRVHVSDNFSRGSSSLLILLFCYIYCSVRARSSLYIYIQGVLYIHIYNKHEFNYCNQTSKQKMIEKHKH